MIQTTTATLIQLLREKETIPDSGAAYTDSTLIGFLNQAMYGFIVPAMMKVQEEHFVVAKNYELPNNPNTSLLNVGNTVTIPSESTGYKLRDVYVVGSDGQPYNLPRMTPTQVASQYFGTSIGPSASITNGSTMGGFFVQGNQLQIFPYGLAAGKTIRITYFRRPNQLTLVSSAAKITNIQGDVLTLGNAITTWTANTALDFIKGSLPNDFAPDPLQATPVYLTPLPLQNVMPIALVSNLLTLAAGQAASLEIGDWVCANGYSVFPQNIPPELYPAMIQKAAGMCIHAAGDAEGYRMAEAEYKQMIDNAMLILSPRVDGKPPKIISGNSVSKASRSSSFGRW